MYSIYKHTFKSSGKSYIGFTHFTMSERLHKHNLNAESGLDTNFYRAIRKYGLDGLVSELLCMCEGEEEAKEREMHFIAHFNTYKKGYNMTEGGDGGNIANNLSGWRLEKYLKLRSQATVGSKNPNHSGHSDDEVVNAAVKMYLETKTFSRRQWMRFAGENGYPQSFSKNRFSGNFNLFKGLVLKELNKRGFNLTMKDLKYKMTQENIDKVAQYLELGRGKK